VHVLLSCAVSLDGYLDDGSDRRLILSNPADLDRVDALRADCDAILVGANTIRVDNPRLLIRSARRRAERVAAGRPEQPMKVTLTRSGALAPEAAFFTAGTAARLVYCAPSVVAVTTARLGGVALVTGIASLPALLADLAGRGVERLLVEGGTAMLTAFLAGGHADELRLAIAPLLVGDPRGARFVGPAAFAPGRLRLAEVDTVGDMAVLRYLLR
jgi:5-amino-6-(5-phosphoribosylamino)uracil reductase